MIFFSIFIKILLILCLGENMKKKLFLLLMPIMFLVGCELGNTPTAKVENLFMKYQKLDSDIDMGIDDILTDQSMTDNQKERYRTLLKNQYRNLTYEIIEELIDGDNASVMVEIEVIDYKRAINDLVFDSNVQTKEQYDDEKLSRLENAKDKVTYTLEIELTKNDDGMWKIDALSNEDVKKIQGMY